MTILLGVPLVSRVQAACSSQRRYWYKKGEYRIRRPHGLSESTFRSGDGWGWLSVCKSNKFVCPILCRTISSIWTKSKKECMCPANSCCTCKLCRKGIRRKTAYTTMSEKATLQKATKTSHLKDRTSPKQT